MRFASEKEAMDAENTDISTLRLNAQCDEYIMDQELRKFPSNKHFIFMMEAQQLEPLFGSRTTFEVVVRPD